MAIINYVGKLTNTTFNFGKHVHQLWEFIYFTSGSGRTVFPDIGVELPFSQGTMLVIPPGVFHEDISDSGYTNVFFTVTQFAWNTSTPFVISDNPIEIIKSMMLQAYETYNLMTEDTYSLLNAVYDVIYAYVCLYSKKESSNVYIEMMKRRITEGYSSPDFRIDEIYKDIPFNKEYARQRFTLAAGMSPSDFLISLRVEHAKRLLNFKNLTNYSVKEISLMCGFNDPLYFSRCFKRITDLSPIQYCALV